MTLHLKTVSITLASRAPRGGIACPVGEQARGSKVPSSTQHPAKNTVEQGVSGLSDSRACTEERVQMNPLGVPWQPGAGQMWLPSPKRSHSRGIPRPALPPTAQVAWCQGQYPAGCSEPLPQAR